MRKTLLVFLTVLFMTPMLSGCLYYPYRDDWNGRGYRHDRGYQDDGNGRGYRYDRGYQDDRGYDGQRDGYRDYRERR